jgi:hypothetical protein
MRFDLPYATRLASPFVMAVLLALAAAGCQTAGTPGPVASNETSHLAVHRQVASQTQKKPERVAPVETTVASALMLGVW